jgi:nucleotide-binding universal stress UspA family protein
MSSDRFVIVVGTDFSAEADHALDRALDEASRREGSEVHVVRVERDRPTASDHTADEVGADATIERVHERVCERLHRMPAGLDDRIGRVVAHYRRGSPAEGLAHLAADLGADLVIVGGCGHSGAPPFTGSVAERIGRLTQCTVWVVPTEGAASGAPPRIEHPCPKHPPREHHRSYTSNGIYAAETTVHGPTPRRSARQIEHPDTEHASIGSESPTPSS